MNAASLTAFRAKARAQSESLYPATVKLGGSDTALAATTAGLRKKERLAVGGMLDDDDIVFRVRKELIDTLPEVGSRILWVEENLTFRIDGIGTGDATSAFYRFGCNAVNA